jgi:hypothetical protein
VLHHAPGDPNSRATILAGRRRIGLARLLPALERGVGRLVEAAAGRGARFQPVGAVALGIDLPAFTQLRKRRTPRGDERSLVLGGGLGSGIGGLLHGAGRGVHGRAGSY